MDFTEEIEIGASLSSSELARVQTLLQQYRRSFATHSTEIGRTDLAEHIINTGDARPVRQPFRRMAPPEKKKVEEIVREMKTQGSYSSFIHHRGRARSYS